jgi:hypothetical protein
LGVLDHFLSEERRYYNCLKSDFTTLFADQFTPKKVIQGWIVTMTTTPDRIQLLQPTLNSLLLSSQLPEKIQINIPQLYRDNTPYIIPDYLLDHPWIHIHRIDQDMGPATKLLPTLHRYQNKNIGIVVCDDDQIYPAAMLETYASQSVDKPNCALCLAGWTVPSTLKLKDRKCLRNGGTKLGQLSNNSIERRIDIMQGVSSYYVNPSLFDEQIFEYSAAPKEAFFVDDVWISGQLARRGIDRWLINIPNRYIRLPNKNTHLHGLHKRENSDNHNDNTMYVYFAEDW